ncbi:hypothetical protein ACIA49_08725 [Kribbella sp. NPDC051587]|uniref:hypothetical protein n=1 Tax=Kribbella sp. NPDC051587 TaxID=3364119 RepID=UPI00378D7411
MRIRRPLAAAAAALLLLSTSLTEANAAEADATHPLKATKAAGPPNYDNCRFGGTNVGSTCFQWVGDVQWVFDGWTNGWAAVVHVQTNYGKDRYCQALPSADGWGTCNYDHEEGKCVRFRLYELKDGATRNWSDWSRWYGTEYGSPC